MNLIAIIGTVEKINKINEDLSILLLKIQKPFLDNEKNGYYELIEVNVNNLFFIDDINNIAKGSLIGLKGRLKNENNNLKVIAERLQIFF